MTGETVAIIGVVSAAVGGTLGAFAKAIMGNGKPTPTQEPLDTHNGNGWINRHGEVVKALGECVGKITSLQETVKGYTEETHDMTQRLFGRIDEHAERIKALEVKAISQPILGGDV